MKLKILVYGINYHPELTGIGKYTGEMCEWLAQRGHKVDIITALPFYPQWKVHKEYKDKGFLKEVRNKVNVYRVPIYVPQKVTGETRVLHELSFNLKSLRYWFSNFFRAHDVVIGICPPLQVGIYPYLYQFFRKRPFIFHIQDLQVDAAKQLGLIKNKKLLSAIEKTEKFLFAKATIVSTISEGIKRKIIEKGISEDKIFLLPNWVDTEFIKPLSKEESLKKEFAFKDTDKIILYSGNIGEKQGLEIVINVAEKLKERKNVYFVFCGEGAAKERLVKMANEKGLSNVKFFPLQPYEKLPRLLAMADIHLVIQKRAASDLVMPSKLTGILAAGGFAIVTADGGTNLYDVVKNNQIGIVTKPEDSGALYETIVYCLDNFSQIEDIKSKARQYAEEHLNKDRILKRFEKLVEGLVDGLRTKKEGIIKS